MRLPFMQPRPWSWERSVCNCHRYRMFVIRNQKRRTTVIKVKLKLGGTTERARHERRKPTHIRQSVFT
ncbi:unnamed protein product, partial [Amoebophrya sp. A120]|eukprot:GSA120T00007785001.1